MSHPGGPCIAQNFLTELAAIARVDIDQLTPETRLVADLGMDSLALAEMAVLASTSYNRDLVAPSRGVAWDTMTVADAHRLLVDGG